MTSASEWECFSDPSYYDMWCVRQKGERRFGHAFHLVNGGEAQKLCEILNKCAVDERLLDLEDRLEIPEPPFEDHDGISCRDETIKQQDKRIKLLEAAIHDWNERTEWVQKTALPKELGLHRADVLRERIESRDAEIERLRAKLERGASAYTHVDGTTYPVHKITDIRSGDD